MAGPAVAVRRDIWRLSDQDPWHPIILAYAEAVAKLRTLDVGNFADPTSWRHLAEIHGSSIPRSQWPRGVHWNDCQHGSWFFLPWHRVYLHHFEVIVRSTVAKLKGPADWALPYWDYSDPQRPNVRQLPPAFRAQQLLNGSPNPLYVAQRAAATNGGGQLPAGAVSTAAALAETMFADAAGGGTVPSFGGPVTGASHSGGVMGTLERVPHGPVHVEVGGSTGWMSGFDTAGRDPIFWLHHANIDRLWSVWLRTAGHLNPTDPRWLRETFEFGSGRWKTKLAARDVLDSTKAPLRYRYEDEPAARPRRVGAPTALRAKRLEAVVRRGPPEMVGASRGEIALTGAPTHAEVHVNPARGAGLKRFAGARQPERIYLKVENVRGTTVPAGLFNVYVNAPERASAATLERHHAGVLSTFGVRESTQSTETHGGEGLSFSFDITDLVKRLKVATQWEKQPLRVTFAPADSTVAAAPSDLRVGRVSLHFG